MVINSDWEISDYSEPLDLFSTSASIALVLRSNLRCEYGAPMFAYLRGGKSYGIVQGCCNHWECIRCGQMVAKKHYGRIVEGARTIAEKHDLYFITVTCRGLELSVEAAKSGYLVWTHRLLRTMQQRHVRHGGDWFYAQVTELQKRGHPHSHILTSFSPDDLVDGAKQSYRTDGSIGVVAEWTAALRSEWLQEMVCKAGLGDQYDISVVESVEACSRYIAKYMFKDSQFSTHFPKGWKRVRYSRSWPKFEKGKTDAFVLLSSDDWHHLSSLALVVSCAGAEEMDAAQYYLRGSDVLIDRQRAETIDLLKKLG